MNFSSPTSSASSLTERRLRTDLAVATTWQLTWGLAAGLVLLTYVIVGFYYDTNDDMVIKLLISGKTAASPVGNLYVYLLGWAYLLSALYRWLPLVSWYDILMVGALYVGLVVSFRLLCAASTAVLNRRQQLVLCILFFVLVYLPHFIVVNFTRPAVLLGALAGLVLVVESEKLPQRAGRWLTAGLLLAAGWGLRPIGASLGVALVVPMLVLLPWRRGPDSNGVSARLGGWADASSPSN